MLKKLMLLVILLGLLTYLAVRAQGQNMVSGNTLPAFAEAGV